MSLKHFFWIYPSADVMYNVWVWGHMTSLFDKLASYIKMAEITEYLLSNKYQLVLTANKSERWIHKRK